MYKRAFFLLMLIIGVFIFTGISFAEKRNIVQIDLIFDASGSMWGRIGGKPKIEIAKNAINTIIDDLSKDKNVQVALRVYGHLNKKCSNSVLEVPMGSIDVAALKNKIKGIVPRGKTPISYSLIQSVKDFNKKIGGDKVIVLITDGMESCKIDPCKTAKELMKAGIITRMHVVGLGLSKKKMSYLQCIANPSKGLVIGAKNALDLTSALKKIVKETIRVNLEITARDSRNKNVFVNYEIYKSNDSSGKVVAKGDNSMDKKASLFLSSGTYNIKIVNNSTGAEKWFRNIKIKEDQKTVKTALFAKRTIIIKIKNSSGKYVYGDVYIYDKSGKELKYADTSMGSQAIFKLLPGIYDIKVFDSGTRKEAWKRDVDVRTKLEFKGEVLVK